MSDGHHSSATHPIGTLAIVAVYGVLFALGWIATYVFVYLSRGAVTP
jgi:hypothetical protein